MLAQCLWRSIRLLPAVALFLAVTTSGYAAQVPSTQDGLSGAPFAQADGNPYYGPGWAGPVNHASMPPCPAWYSPHTVCASEAAPSGAQAGQ